MILPIPQEKQLYDWDCGIKCLHNIMKYYGMNIKYSVLLSMSTHEEKWGVDPKTIEIIAGEFDLKTRTVSEGIDILRTAIIQQYPAIVLYQTDLSQDSGHYATVCGFENRNIILNDPNRDKLVSYPIPEFQQRWYGAGTSNLAIFIIK